MLSRNKPAFLCADDDDDEFIEYNMSPDIVNAEAVEDLIEKENPVVANSLREVNAALQKAHSLDILDRRLKSGLQRAMVQEEQLARDLAVFGETHREEILAAHDITAEEMLAMLENEKFTQRIQAIRTEINHDTKGLIRARASMYLEAGLDNAYEIANDTTAKDADRMKAIQFLAVMADAMPKNTGISADGTPVATSGVNVVFNFGQHHPKTNELKGIVIEHGE